MKKTAIVAITKYGRLLALKIHKGFEADLYFSSKIIEKDDQATSYEGSQLGQLYGELFSKYDAVVCIMALGIVVRKIAPYIQDKRYDPAVVVLDELGRSTISLLSGHLGGANQLTREIAAFLGSHPVITTATDMHNKLALDLFAQKYNCKITPFSNLKKISGAIVNEKKVAFYTQYDLPEDITSQEISVYPLDEYDGEIKEDFAVFLTNKEIEVPQSKTIVFLRPQNIAVGLGCRRGKEKEEIEKAAVLALAKSQISLDSVAYLSSIDIKSDEAGILALSDKWQKELRFFSKEEIEKEDKAESFSAFVKEKIGVNGVCEQTALLSLKDSHLILEKSVLVPGVTVAVAEGRFL